MRIVDFFHTLLKSSVEVMVAVADVLGSAAGAAAHARRTGVAVPAAPAAWQAQVRALDQATRETDAAADALAVADALSRAMLLFDEFRTFYLAKLREQSAGAEAANFLRLLLPIIFQIYLRDGTSGKFGTVLALLIVLDRRLAEATSEATFDGRLLRWASATWSKLSDSSGDGGDGGAERPEAVAVVLAIGLLIGSWGLRKLQSPNLPWFQTDPDTTRSIFRIGYDDLANDFPPAQHIALSRALTMFYPPQRGAFLDEAAFKQLRPLPRPWVESGASITVLPVPAVPGVHGGAVGLYVEGNLTRRLDRPEDHMTFEVEIDPGYSVLLPVGEPILPLGPPVALNARAAVTYKLPKDGRSDATGVTLELQELRLEARVDAPGAVPALTIIVALRGLELASGGLLPFRGKADLTVRYDTRSNRFAFEGGLGLEVRKRFALGSVDGANGQPTGDALAEATLLARLALARSDAGFVLQAELLADLTLRISRFVTLSLAGAGIRFSAGSQPGGAGRLMGIADADLQAVPPSGIGIAINLHGVTGGGMLRLANGRVSGVVELAIGKKLRLTGVGQYDSRSRWLLLVAFERPGAGPLFVPKGIGLLVAQGREANAEALRSALGTGELEMVLMPRDVVANESRIMAALDRFFPPGDATLIGMMLLFASPRGDFTARIGVIAELPDDPKRGIELHLLALMQLKIPGQKPWSLDGVGLWDLGRGEGYLRLQLRDALLWGAEFTGSALIFHGDPDGDGPVGKGTWISLGGFYPGYPLPGPVMQGMTRLGVVVRRGDKIRLSCGIYLALTPGSAQLGVAIELHAAYLGFSFDGGLSFDAFIASDYSCVIDFHAHLTLKVLGRTLAGLGVDATYTQTDRYHLKGAAHYEFLCFSGTKHFSCDLGERDAPRLPVAELEQALAAELARPAAWREPLAAGVVLVARERGVTLSPDGRAHFEQSLLPLNVTIDLFGMQRLAQPKALRIEVTSVGSGAPLQSVRVGEFSPGLFFEMSQQQALRAPVTVQHDNGFEFQLPLRAGTAREVADDWEDVIVDPLYVPPAPPPGPRPRHVRGSLPKRVVLDAAPVPPRPVRVHAVTYRSAGEAPMTWMHAWARAKAPPLPPAAPPGVMFALVSPPPVQAAGPLLEAWK